MSEVTYWTSIYEKKDIPSEPSNFAIFVKDTLKDVNSVLEVGSGNGRDAYFSL